MPATPCAWRPRMRNRITSWDGADRGESPGGGRVSLSARVDALRGPRPVVLANLALCKKNQGKMAEPACFTRSLSPRRRKAWHSLLGLRTPGRSRPQPGCCDGAAGSCADTRSRQSERAVLRAVVLWSRREADAALEILNGMTSTNATLVPPSGSKRAGCSIAWAAMRKPSPPSMPVGRACARSRAAYLDAQAENLIARLKSFFSENDLPRCRGRGYAPMSRSQSSFWASALGYDAPGADSHRAPAHRRGG